MRNDNYPDDIRRYDNDHRSPFFSGADYYDVNDGIYLNQAQQEFIKDNFDTLVNWYKNETEITVDNYDDLKSELELFYRDGFCTFKIEDGFIREDETDDLEVEFYTFIQEIVQSV